MGDFSRILYHHFFSSFVNVTLFHSELNTFKWKHNCLKKISSKIGATTNTPRHTQPSGVKAMNVWLKVTIDCVDFCAADVPQHKYNKWRNSECMGEWINQQRCYIVWNATINHSGLMSGNGKCQRCKEQLGEDAPFLFIYYSESVETFLIV